MGHIREPKGVDFIIKSEPLTDSERTAISEYIRNFKQNKSNRSINSARTKRPAKVKPTPTH